jgi:hypothetical protein
MNVHVRENTVTSSEETESWTICFDLIGAPPERDIAEITNVDKDDITLGLLLTMTSRFGYSVRDFLYYKKRSGNNVATLHEIETESDVSLMITINDEERKARLVLSKDRITARNVSVTPMKKSSGTTVYEDEFTNVALNDYKVWLAELHEDGKGHGKLSCCTSFRTTSYFIGTQFNNTSMFPELQDTFRIDTVKAYTEWLRHVGQLDDIGT